jgi:asparagine synthase (glutamine-hydrolysing)
MCGITGFIAFTGKYTTLKQIEQMNNQIRHRGPDDEGYYCLSVDNQTLILAGNDTNQNHTPNLIPYLPEQQITDYQGQHISLALGHRRLSILDLSPFGHQPLSVDNNNYWISYNGEVYNYLEIRQELEILGHKFVSHSDTEVILSAYKQWGAQCLAKFNGMFAFIIYDAVNKHVFIARDRFGVKPLYYYSDESGIYLASEIKQFTQLASWQPHLNHQVAHDFLVYGLSDHTSQTMFKHVKQLRGGESAIINTLNFSSIADFQINRWYHLDTSTKQIKYDTASQKFRELFIESVKLRLRSDVKVGSCLSGGLDSSAIVSVMADLLKERNSGELLNTFSACSVHKEFDEKEYIDEVVTHSKATPFYCYPNLDDLLAVNDKLTWHQDEPFGSTSIFAQWSVFELAKKQNVTVMLDGQGADEQLAGYQGLYFQIYLNELLANGKLVKFIQELKAFHKIHGIAIKPTLIKSVINLFPPTLKKQIGKFLGKPLYNISWLNNDAFSYQDINPFLVGGMNNCSVKDTLYAQIMHNNLSMLLHWEDRDSMAHSIESRVPFLDYRLVEFIFSLPTEYKINAGISKRILRDGLDGILPDKIKNRMSKLGFATPEEVWVKQNHLLFRDKLIDALEVCPTIFNRTQVLEIFDEIIAGKRAFGFWLWRIISFGTWFKLFKVKL